jgi:hypothetical protein
MRKRRRAVGERVVVDRHDVGGFFKLRLSLVVSSFDIGAGGELDTLLIARARAI